MKLKDMLKVLKKPAEETEALQEMDVIKKFDNKSDRQKEERDRMNKHFNGKSYVKDGIESDF